MLFLTKTWWLVLCQGIRITQYMLMQESLILMTLGYLLLRLGMKEGVKGYGVKGEEVRVIKRQD